MVTYIEGFLIPVPTGRREDYRKVSAAVGALYLEYGASRVVESWGEGLDHGTRTSFPRAVDLAEGESVVFAWIEFPDKAARDACHEKVWTDPCMDTLRDDSLVDGARMIWGDSGFPISLQVSTP